MKRLLSILLCLSLRLLAQGADVSAPAATISQPDRIVNVLYAGFGADSRGLTQQEEAALQSSLHWEPQQAAVSVGGQTEAALVDGAGRRLGSIRLSWDGVRNPPNPQGAAYNPTMADFTFETENDSNCNVFSSSASLQGPSDSLVLVVAETDWRAWWGLHDPAPGETQRVQHSVVFGKPGLDQLELTMGSVGSVLKQCRTLDPPAAPTVSNSTAAGSGGTKQPDGAGDLLDFLKRADAAADSGQSAAVTEAVASSIANQTRASADAVKLELPVPGIPGLLQNPDMEQGDDSGSNTPQGFWQGLAQAFTQAQPANGGQTVGTNFVNFVGACDVYDGRSHAKGGLASRCDASMQALGAQPVGPRTTPPAALRPSPPNSPRGKSAPGGSTSSPASSAPGCTSSNGATCGVP